MTSYAFKFEMFTDPVNPPDPGPSTNAPWWMCAPKETPTPCPVRPVGFVPLSEYDNDFKYPLASSSKPAQIVREEECAVCRPNLVDQEDPEPPQDCWSFIWPEGYGDLSEFRKDWFEFPEWFVMNDPVTIDFGQGYPEWTYETSSADLWYRITADDGFSGPASGQGILTQGSNSICLDWEIGEPGT